MSTARQSAERACELSALLARHCDLPANVIARHVCHLQRMARQAVKAAENLCNLPDYQEIYDRQSERLDGHARGICSAIGKGFAVKIGGDPRGACFFLQIPGVEGDGWDAERGHAVY